MRTKKDVTIGLYYELSEILTLNAIVRGIKVNIPTKPVKIILKDLTNLTITGYYESFEHLLSLPMKELLEYEKEVELDKYISEIEIFMSNNRNVNRHRKQYVRILELLILITGENK